ncbi:hypothetical protein F0L68_10535 [Solihabitans fulvus]|uniref:SpaA-like prealbumin fold domain-containing protein n=1 Tax=Solihabitans fulvus TaxID=1892852 RepID=A0A5B2XJ14_9PSEU|nr:hypothetical protein [Solihabitans fulvus]KAA2263246.1 hypothetical protein F0L68_10535 [Solihabitans fulvus]
MGWRRLVAGLAGMSVVAGMSLLAMPGNAGAAPQQGIGWETPAQPYFHNPDAKDWLGSYVVDGKQVWCVRFEFKAPDSQEKYHDGDELLTKWGQHLSPEVASDISYLLLRYTSTTSADEAAALAHLLHSWTAHADDPSWLDPSRTYDKVAYDETSHFNALPKTAQDAVARLKADATTNHGPWTTSITAPKEPQLIGTPGNWTVQVNRPDKTGVAGVPVNLTLTDAQLDGGATTGTVKTGADGAPLAVKVTPTGPNPKVAISVDAPADKPKVHIPTNDATVQQIVTTGGETKLPGEAKTTAQTAPGVVKIAKTDADSHAAIAGVSLRITSADKAAPAVKQDGTPLVGPDGKPSVVQTGQDGTASVPDLKTPQDICLIETAAPQGYEQSFDANSPPSVCGTVTPGQTLALALVNKPNKVIVPSTIPAGDTPPAAVGRAAVVSAVEPAGLFGFGGLVLLGAALVGVVVRRKATGQR